MPLFASYYCSIVTLPLPMTSGQLLWNLELYPGSAERDYRAVVLLVKSANCSSDRTAISVTLFFVRFHESDGTHCLDVWFAVSFWVPWPFPEHHYYLQVPCNELLWVVS